MAVQKDIPGTSPLIGAGSVLQLIRDREGMTRSDLARITGLARSTVAQRVDALLAHELVYEAGGTASTGGRPPTLLTFNQSAGVVLVADLGATHSRLAASDLAGAPLAEEAFDMDIAAGPERVLGMVNEHFSALLSELGRTPDDVRGIGIGVPGPVAFHKGQPVKPPIMPGWNGFPIPRWFSAHYDAPVLVDNDVNIMALGEHWANWRETEHLMFVKVGTGIGCGIVAGRAIHRGAQGAAGDIGHIRLRRPRGRRSAAAATSAASRRWRAAARSRGGSPRRGSRRPTAATSCGCVRADDVTAVRMVREAGRSLGEVLAGCVNFFNPGVIVIGGDVGEAPELLAGVREVTIQRSLPLATGELAIVASRLGDRAGVVGAAIMVVEHVLAPDVVDRVVQAGAAA